MSTLDRRDREFIDSLGLVIAGEIRDRVPRPDPRFMILLVVISLMLIYATLRRIEDAIKDHRAGPPAAGAKP